MLEVYINESLACRCFLDISSYSGGKAEGENQLAWKGSLASGFTRALSQTE